MQGEIDLNRFKIVKKINNGGFGFVYQIQEKKTKEFYAAKIVVCKDNKEKYKKMVNSEVSIMMHTKHPTIIKFIGYSKIDFDNENNITIIMELAKNGSLREVLRQIQQSDGPRNYTNTTRQIILVGVARGIKYLHDRHILHRDIKPENILLDKELRPHITDFGLSKKYDGISSNNSEFGGTLPYEAPEVLKAQKYNRKVDVYSFAILMYEVLTDSVPYPKLLNGKMSKYDFMNNVINRRYRPKFLVPVKDSLRELIEQCWSENPLDRPTFEEIFDKLSNKINIEDDEENYLLEGVDKDELNLYVEDITQITDPIEKVLSENSTLKEEVRMISDKNKELTEKNENLKSYITKLKIKSQKLSDTNKMLHKINEKLNNEKEKLITENTELSDAKKALEEDNSQLNVDKKKLRIENKKLSDLNKMLDENNEQLNSEMEKLITENTELSDANKALKEKNKQLDSEKKDLIEENERLSDSSSLNKEASLLYVAQNFLEGKDGFPCKPKRAVKLLELGVKLRNVEVMQYYGSLLINGINVTKNEEKGISMVYEAATILNSSDIKLQLVNMILSNDNNNNNFRLAKRYCKEAADSGNTKAMVLYGNLCMKEKKSKHDEICSNFEEASNYFKQAADNGDAEGMAHYGRFLEYGYTKEPNLEEALNYYKRSNELNDMTGKSFYGSKLIEGIEGIIPKNEEEGLRLVKYSCDNENPYGMANYGYFLSKGISSDDPSQPLRYYKMAAELGCPVAFANLGVCYRDGAGIKKDIKLAIKYFKMAKEEGYPRSALLLGNLLLKGDEDSSLRPDLKEGQKYFQYAADHGNKRAMYLFAYNMYYYPRIFEMNAELLRKYLEKGVDYKVTDCMRLLGEILMKGDVLPQDKVLGLEYIKMAADLGDIKAKASYNEAIDIESLERLTPPYSPR